MQTEQPTIQKKKKGAIANSRVGILDKETGEVIDDGSLIYVPKKARIKDFFMAMQSGFEFIAKSNLNREALSVLMLIMSRMDYENAIWISQKEICEILCMKKQNVSRAMKALREAGVLDSGERRAVYLSADIGWKGKVLNLRKHQSIVDKKSKERSKPTKEQIAESDMEISRLSKYSDSIAPSTH